MNIQHQRVSSGKDEWLTPQWITERLGPFDVDPCSPVSRPWDTARKHYSVLDNGLSKQWLGRVWCNPPYGTETAKWVLRCAEHGNAIVLIFARTETRTFFDAIWGRADGLLFLKGRLRFCHVTGLPADNSGAPSVLVAYGHDNATRLKTSGIAGAWVGATEHCGSPQTIAQQPQAVHFVNAGSTGTAA